MKRAATKFARAAVAIALAGVGLVHAPAAMAQAHPSLEGTWKLTPAQTKLMPVGGSEYPFTKDGRTDYDKNRREAAKKDYGFDQTMATCSAPGLPRIMIAPGRMRILERPTVVSMMFEWNRQLRQIEMRPMEAKRPEVDSMGGMSYGKWEGDTLVVKSLGFLPGKLLDSYLPSGGSLELTERFRLRDQDTLEDQVTITDPDNFTRPWQTNLVYKRQADVPFAEDICLDRKKAGQPAIAR